MNMILGNKRFVLMLKYVLRLSHVVGSTSTYQHTTSISRRIDRITNLINHHCYLIDSE